jgi:hypothetical protein
MWPRLVVVVIVVVVVVLKTTKDNKYMVGYQNMCISITMNTQINGNKRDKPMDTVSSSSSSSSSRNIAIPWKHKRKGNAERLSR